MVIGEKVVMIRDATDEEWGTIGRVPSDHLKNRELVIKCINSKSLDFEGELYSYPTCIFVPVNANYDIW